MADVLCQFINGASPNATILSNKNRYGIKVWLLALPKETGAFQIFANIITEFIGFSTSASVRPHKKAVKKNEAEGAKEKQ
jgi:hypothetical protein